MRVRLSNPGFLRNLARFLEGRECVVVQAKGDTIEVWVPDAPRRDAARLELDLYLAAWRATHPTVDARVVD
jgi:hypothetical protein